MKKLLLVILLATLVLIINSCQKDNESTSQNIKAENNLNKILEFRNTILNAGHLKSGQEFTIDEVVNNYEGSINVTYGSASFNFEETYQHLFTIKLALNSNEKISLQEASDKYFASIDSIRAFYQSIEKESKQLIVADVELLRTDKSEIELLIAPVVGIPPINLFTFGPTDYWEWGMGNGKCGGYENPIYEGHDAAEQIENKVHARKSVPAGNYTYANVVTPWIYSDADEFLNPNDPVYGDNNRDFLLYGNFGSWPNCNTCIPPNDMNFYLLGTETVINQLVPVNKNWIFIDLIGDYLYVQGGYYVHRIKVTYGDLLYTGETPEKL